MNHLIPSHSPENQVSYNKMLQQNARKQLGVLQQILVQQILATVLKTTVLKTTEVSCNKC